MKAQIKRKSIYFFCNLTFGISQMHTFNENPHEEGPTWHSCLEDTPIN